MLSRIIGVIAALLAAPAVARPAGAAAPVTPAGWKLTPAGTQTTVPIGPGLAGPWGLAIAPDGKSVLVTSSGTAARFESVERFALGSLDRTGLVPYDGAQGQSVFYGIAYSPDGKRAWASGGGQNVVHAFEANAKAAPREWLVVDDQHTQRGSRRLRH